MPVTARAHPSVFRKLRQLLRVARDSYRLPVTGTPCAPVLVEHEEMGITFIGHSSFLIQIGGRNLLVDPVFTRSLLLLRRARRPGLRVRDLPPVDAVLLTHAHMDHLHRRSLRQVVRHTRGLTGVAPEVIVPVGVADLVEHCGFRMTSELEWWQDTELRAADGTATGVTVTLTPARHWGARLFQDTHRRFGGYVIAGGGHSVYHAGDTAYFSGFHQIGARLQPQVALLPIGAYFPDSYRAVHTSPEEALRAFIDLRTARTMIPMHFGTFPLGREPMGEPPVRLLAAAEQAQLASRVRVLADGETVRFDPGRAGTVSPGERRARLFR